METKFTDAQLADPRIAEANGILRNCVHCGFCTATCPTYLLLGDELDSPRGRIYLIREMLQSGGRPSPRVVKHIDRCLSCLSCVTTCPADVDYMHLVDRARAHIHDTYRRPIADRLIRWSLAALLPHPGRFFGALKLAALGRPFAPLFRAIPGLKPVAAMLDLAPSTPSLNDMRDLAAVHPAKGERRARVAMLAGCVQPVLAPQINDATIRLLNRLGVEVVVPPAQGCCGALVHHMGKEQAAHAAARKNIDVWLAEAEGGGLDAIIINASGCGTMVKDYAHMLAGDADYADKARRISALTLDITEFLTDHGLGTVGSPRMMRIAYHSACSMQHGQKITAQPKDLLRSAGFEVVDVPEGHICCGSAGVYNVLQPEIARQLRDRKIANIDRTEPAIVATGNVGCITQLASGMERPVVHTVELLDWATGGPVPMAIKDMQQDPA